MFIKFFYWLFNKKKYKSLQQKELEETYVDSFGIRRKKKNITFTQREINMEKKIVEQCNREEALKKSSKNKSSSDSYVDTDHSSCSNDSDGGD